MSLKRLLNLIDNTKIGSLIDKKLTVVEKTDPDKIYVENVREFFNLSHGVAKALCDIAVKEDIFRKKIGVICPNDNCRRIIKSYDAEDKQDETITCLPCSLKGEEETTFNTNSMEKIIFYQLKA
jgi:hypothetical protein